MEFGIQGKLSFTNIIFCLNKIKKLQKLWLCERSVFFGEQRWAIVPRNLHKLVKCQPHWFSIDFLAAIGPDLIWPLCWLLRCSSYEAVAFKTLTLVCHCCTSVHTGHATGPTISALAVAVAVVLAHAHSHGSKGEIRIALYSRTYISSERTPDVGNQAWSFPTSILVCALFCFLF